MNERKEYSREERIAGMKAIIAFLEANPDFDIPEGMDHCLVRTLPRQNRGQLKDKASVSAWFRKHVEILKPDTIHADDDFTAIREFGGGARVIVEVHAPEVCDRLVESRTVSQPITVEEVTWRAPQELSVMGFVPDQGKLRERDSWYKDLLTRSR